MRAVARCPVILVQAPPPSLAPSPAPPRRTRRAEAKGIHVVTAPGKVQCGPGDRTRRQVLGKAVDRTATPTRPTQTLELRPRTLLGMRTHEGMGARVSERASALARKPPAISHLPSCRATALSCTRRSATNTSCVLAGGCHVPAHVGRLLLARGLARSPMKLRFIPLIRSIPPPSFCGPLGPHLQTPRPIRSIPR